MTEYPFPPVPPAWHVWLQVGLPMVLVGILVGSLVLAVRRSRKPAAAADLAVWVLIAVVATVLWRSVARTPFNSTATVVTAILINALAIVSASQVLLRKTLPGAAAFWLNVLCVVAMSCMVGTLLAPRETSHHNLAGIALCKNNLKQLAISVHDFYDERGYCPLPQFTAGDEPPRSWRVEMLPFLDNPDLREQYIDSEPWDSPGNSCLLPSRPNTYLCPSTPERVIVAAPYIASYAMPTGPGTFGNGRRQTFPEIRDGLSNTAVFVEACGRNLVWLQPHDVEFEECDVGINQPGNRPGYSQSMFSSYHSLGVNVALGDGSVRSLANAADPQVLRALLTIDGREPLDPAVR